MAAYKKKSEFGPASIKIRTDDKPCFNSKIILENGSSISINSNFIFPNTLNVYEKLYPSNW